TTDGARQKIILFGGGEIYRQGLDYCRVVESTIVAGTPDGGMDAAYFPELVAADWDISVAAAFPASGDVPAYRYERAVRRGPVKPLT
ncbi:MAG: dihydrofolate reductase, partial [Alphaproteobacteria bacterium]|nr:dihydrofolate reductase [Alphaproteobacteria bacterium]